MKFIVKKLNKLLKQVKRLDIEAKTCIHIIENDYCYSCKGKCKYEDNNQRVDIGEGVVIIYGDLPDDTESFAGVPEDTLIKIANYGDD